MQYNAFFKYVVIDLNLMLSAIFLSDNIIQIFLCSFVLKFTVIDAISICKCTLVISSKVL